MNFKKSMGIAMILLLVVVAGVTAQSKTADQLISRWRKIVRAYEALANESGSATFLEKKGLEDRFKKLQRELKTLGEDTNIALARGELTDAQYQKIEDLGMELLTPSQQIARNLEKLVNR